MFDKRFDPISASQDDTVPAAAPDGLLVHPDRFLRRHIGPNPDEIRSMLETLGLSTLEQLVDATVPKRIRTARPLKLTRTRSEYNLLTELRGIAARNRVFKSYIGMGYSDCITPGVIQRNILENPGWYTQYTPYQAEISQGRLESLLNFQTMIIDLTGMQIANASLLDEGTAAAEAMTMCHGLSGERNRILVADSCHPQTIDIIRTRAEPLGISVTVAPHGSFQMDAEVFAILLQYPASTGAIHDYRELVRAAHQAGALVIVAADLLSLALLTPPGEWGADVVVGSAQRFGVPLGFGGPHAAFFATRDSFKRNMPGRLVGVSRDNHGRPAYRLSLQTREQHIRREKATSNICTAQALLANMAAMYAVYHGPVGLRKIAERVRRLTLILAEGLKRIGHEVASDLVFDTVVVTLKSGGSDELRRIAEKHQINLRILSERALGISLDETTNPADVADLWRVFNGDSPVSFSVAELAGGVSTDYPAPFQRASSYLQHPVFNRFHSETEMLRYLRRLETRDLSLTHSMIPLGSCTMKLNASAEMFPVSWPEFGRLHPFAPLDQSQGYQTLFKQLESWLAEITGFSGVSLQPNAGSQGEYAGLLTIQQYHKHRGEAHRKVCLIPTSAHGTNPASAVMAGMEVVAVACDKQGNIDLEDLRKKAGEHESRLAALMVTYPSTHGVFEETIQDICRIVHGAGGQVYMDGANLNAQVGLCRPGELGADVCHINLHKTFCIPHGGGGPGMGPICVAEHLIPFLPSHPLAPSGDRRLGAVSAAPWGSASILVISWVYIALMGGDGLREATEVAILNANYIARRLDSYFPVLYKGKSGMVAHECILDLRQFKSVTVEDVAKRLMDYGFHAPTISWPVPGTMMVEPTESESRTELDRFCNAMIAIHAEIQAIESGRADAKNNLLKNAPHTAEAVISDKWDRPYPREQAAFPAPETRENKFWPAVGRIDNVFGDRNLVCSCVGMDAFESVR